MVVWCGLSELAGRAVQRDQLNSGHSSGLMDVQLTLVPFHRNLLFCSPPLPPPPPGLRLRHASVSKTQSEPKVPVHLLEVVRVEATVNAQ